MLIYTTEKGNIKYEQIIHSNINKDMCEIKKEFIEYVENNSKFRDIEHISEIQKGWIIKCTVNLARNINTKYLKIRFELNSIDNDEIKLIGVLSDEQYKNEFRPIIDRTYTEIQSKFS